MTRLVVGLAIALTAFIVRGQVEQAATILHMLDYVAVDYPEAVDAGAVKNEDEFKEMLEFTARVTDSIKALPENAARSALVQNAESLAALVGARARHPRSPRRRRSSSGRS